MSATPYWRLIKAAQAELRANIRQMAADRGWNLADLARLAPIKYGPLTQGLGAYRWFNEDEVGRIAGAFEVSADELMGASVFKHEARGSEFDLPMPADAKVGVSFGRGRALCCTCGSLRRFRRDELGQGREVLDIGDDPAGHRMVLQLDCGICGGQTTHAELRSDEHRDIAEERQAEPTHEQQYRVRFRRLVERLAEFNIEVSFYRRPEEDLDDGWTTRYWLDRSAGRWRIEIDPRLPSSLQYQQLAGIWEKKLSVDEHGETHPRSGRVLVKPADAHWAWATECLVADIERALPLEQQRLRLHVVDEVMSAGDTEVSR